MIKEKFDLNLLCIHLTSEYEKIAQFAQIALENRLYVKDREFTLRGTLKSVIRLSEVQQPHLVKRISLAYYDSKPVGVAICKSPSFSMQFNSYKTYELYVKKRFRRLGIGSKLISSIHIKNDLWLHGDGVKGSKSFFYSMRQKLAS